MAHTFARAPGARTAPRSVLLVYRRVVDDLGGTMSSLNLQLGTSQIRLDPARNRVFAGRDATACGLAHLDPGLSRRHAEVWIEAGQTFIRDLGSANGTWV